MKFIDEVDIELVNQELNFHTQDNNLVIKGACDLFTTKPIGSDRKLFKTIDKHLDQIIEDNQFSRSMERERQNSINSLFGTSASPPLNRGFNHRRGSYTTERERRLSNNSTNFNKDFSNASANTSFIQQQKDLQAQYEQQLPVLVQSEVSESNPKGDLYDTENAQQPQGQSGSAISDESEVDESPFGPLKNITTRKTFAYLIAILNSTYPDHDFSNLQPTTENFHRIPDAEDLINKFNNLLISLGKKETTLNWIWDTMNVYMDILPSKTSSPSLSAQAGGNGNSSRKNSFANNSLPKNTIHGDAGSNSTSNNSNNTGGSHAFESCQIYSFEPSDESILDDLNYPYQTMWSYYWFIYNKKKKRVSFIYLTAINKIHYSLVNNNQLNGSSVNNRNGASKVINGDDDDDDENAYMAEYLDEDAIDDDDDNDNLNDDVVGDLEI